MSDEPDVLHLITRLLNGGAEAKTVAAVTGLDGYKFTVGYGASYTQVQVTRLHDAGVTTRRFRLIRHYNPASAVPAVISVAKYLLANDFDIVHTHSTEAGIIGRTAAHLVGVPAIVHTVHGVPFSDDRSDVLNRFLLACERRVAPVTDRIITNADAIAQEYLSRDIGSPVQYSTVYSGIDIERFATAPPAGDLSSDRLRITMVSRLVDGKGLWVLLDAIESLDDFVFSVTIVGDGPLRTEFVSAVKNRGLADVVEVLGYRHDVEGVLSASDVFVLPSFREGTPRVITEAMASGLPVVATDIAGIPEQVQDGENGYLVPAGDSAALADRLKQLLNSANRRERFGEASTARIDRFSEKRMLKDLDDIYSIVLAK